MATSSEKVTENVTFDLAIAKSVESNDVVGILLERCGKVKSVETGCFEREGKGNSLE